VSPTPPQLSQEQRVAASKLAVANRRRRAEVKREVKLGHLSLRQVLDLAAVDEVVAQMRAIDLLESLPSIGEVKAARLMRTIDIAASRRLRGLGPKQREDLLRLVG
jgi:hypothetical protein